MSTEKRFQQLLEEHRKILYKVSNSYCRQRDDREDLTQEILIQLWRAFPKFDARVRFSTWMYKIALNVAISFYRREAVRTRHVVPASERTLAAVETQAQPENVRLLYQFIERLEPLNKALVLLYLDGNSHLEIAEILGITESNAATKLNRLKNTMKQELGETQ